MNNSQLKIVEYTVEFLEYSWIWLNEPEVKALTNTPDFSKEDQASFFEALPNKKDYLIKGILIDGNPIGACGLKQITKHDAEYWGYIGEKQYWGKGLGKEILAGMINSAKELNLSSIYLKVIHDNLRAINLYKKMGFEVECEAKEEILMRLHL